MYKETVTMYFSKQLRDKIMSRELPLDYVANYCEISLPRLKDCLRGEWLPKPWQIVLMAEVLYCSVNDLLGFKHFSNPSQVMASTIPQGEYRISEFLWNEVKYHMERKRVSVKKLAEYADVKPETIENWMRQGSHSYPKTFALIRICDALDCTPSDLLGY